MALKVLNHLQCPKCMNTEKLSANHKYNWLNKSRRLKEDISPRVIGSAGSTERHGPFCSQQGTGERLIQQNTQLSLVSVTPAEIFTSVSRSLRWNPEGSLENSWESWRKSLVCNQWIQFPWEDLIRRYSSTYICISEKCFNSAYSSV